jgi:Family of unknown function (DUF6345)
MKSYLFVTTVLFLFRCAYCGDKEPPCNINFPPDLIPLVNESLPVFNLGDAVLAPRSFVNSILHNVVPDCELKECEEDGTLTAHVKDSDTVVGFVDSCTGESHVFPLFENLTPSCSGLKDLATQEAEKLACRDDLFPTQESERVIALPPIILSRSNNTVNGNATEPEDTLAYVQFQRQINGYPVRGPGTQALIAVAGDKSIKALTHRWRSASHCDKEVCPHTREKVVDSILCQLSKLAKNGENLAVQKVSVVYYDGGLKFLQPVYRFEGTITPPTDARVDRPTSIGFVGYVSIGEEVEPLPDLSQSPEQSPIHPPTRRRSRTRNIPRKHTDPTVGRYVVQNDSSCWVESANSFWNNLQQGSAISGIPFTNPNQYYWAQSFMYTSDKNSFVNSVNIALTEAHGNWWYFTNYQNWGDGVELSQIGTAGGYGANAGGSLAYWILHSCEVIPTQVDESTSFDVWWNIFRGMHSVVGYRTLMTICDQVTSLFGKCVGVGAPVVPSWFQAVLNNADYSSPNDIQDFNDNRKIYEPRGRASSVSVCGHADDAATYVEGLQNPSCLWEYWLNN